MGTDMESLGAIQTSIERGGHVPDYRRNLQRGEALLHSRQRGG